MNGEQLLLFPMNNYDFPKREIIIDFDGADFEAKQQRQQEERRQPQQYQSQETKINSITNVAIECVARKFSLNANFSNIHISVANIALNALNDFTTAFPKLPPLFFIGNDEKANEALSKERKIHYRNSKRHNQHMSTIVFKNDDIFAPTVTINPKYFFQENTREHYVSREKFRAMNTDNTLGDLVHELGHVLDHWLKLRYDPLIKGLFISLRKKKIIKNLLSEYGNTNTVEFIAEALAEYYCNEHPREIASIVGHRTLELYQQQYGR